MSDKRTEQYYRSYLAHHNVSRRGLFRGLLSGANRSFKEAAKTTDPSKTFATVPRPPYAVDESLFLALCDPSCQQCETACPQHIIEMVDNQAQVNLDYNHCTFCEACASACSSGALLSFASQNPSSPPLNSQPQPRAQINVKPTFLNSCNNLLSGACTICADACSKQAIEIKNRALPEIDITHCNGCGSCRSACFIGAIEMTCREDYP